MVLGMNVTTKTGTILSICLVSSTWVTGDSVHGELVESVLTAALSRNLKSMCKALTLKQVSFCFYNALTYLEQ